MRRPGRRQRQHQQEAGDGRLRARRADRRRRVDRQGLHEPDRVDGLLARWLAMQCVQAGVGRRVRVQLEYRPNSAQPESVQVWADGWVARATAARGTGGCGAGCGAGDDRGARPDGLPSVSVGAVCAVGAYWRWRYVVGARSPDASLPFASVDRPLPRIEPVAQPHPRSSGGCRTRRALADRQRSIAQD